MIENKFQTPKLELDSVSVGYGKRILISDIAMSLQKGEIVTLIGPNGGGKSTILKSITKHLALMAGTVYLDGRDMSGMNGKDLAMKMAVVLTERIRPEMMSCRELVAAGRYPYTGSFGRLASHDREIVQKSLELVNALDIADKEITEISDGQRQRIMLARAICQEPEIIVLDEPTSFLDIRHKIELLEILRTMAKERQIAVVMSLHEIDLAERISDRIVCVKGDRIAAYGTPGEIFSDEMVRKLYEIDEKKGTFYALTGSVELAKPVGDLKFFVIGGGGYGIPVYRMLQKKGVPFAAGILLSQDLECGTVCALSDHVIIAKPFCAMGKDELDAAKELITKVPAVIDCECPVGELNAVNGELIAWVKSQGKKIEKPDFV